MSSEQPSLPNKTRLENAGSEVSAKRRHQASRSPDSSPEFTFDQRASLRELAETEARQTARAETRVQRRSNIAEYEEGVPRPGWFTDADWRKMHPNRH
jgi:hypothetical protein